jgi:hypothetical protein
VKTPEVRGTSAPAPQVRYVLTDLGRDRAGQFWISALCRSGSFRSRSNVRAGLDAARPYLDRQTLSNGFENLIVSTGMLDQLTGCTGQGAVPLRRARKRQDRLAEGIGKALGGEMRAIHRRGRLGDHDTTRSATAQTNPRASTAWCRSLGTPMGMHSPAGRRSEANHARDARPDVQPDLEILRAPIQMKAIGGVSSPTLRPQRIPPRDLLNR